MALLRGLGLEVLLNNSCAMEVTFLSGLCINNSLNNREIIMKKIEYYKDPVPMTILPNGELRVGSPEELFDNLDIDETLHLILEPGQATRYEFIIIPLEDSSLIISQPLNNLCWQIFGITHPTDFSLSPYIPTQCTWQTLLTRLWGLRSPIIMTGRTDIRYREERDGKTNQLVYR